MQTSIRKKLEDAKVERDRSQQNEDIRSLRDEIAELRYAACNVLWPSARFVTHISAHSTFHTPQMQIHHLPRRAGLL